MHENNLIIQTSALYRTLKHKDCFPLSSNFSARMHVKFTSVNEIEAMYERPRGNVNVEPRSIFTLTRDRPYLIYARKNYATLEINP